MQDLSTEFRKVPIALHFRLLYKIGQLLLKASRMCQLLWHTPLLDILHHRETAVLPDGHQQFARGTAWLLSMYNGLCDVSRGHARD